MPADPSYSSYDAFGQASYGIGNHCSGWTTFATAQEMWNATSNTGRILLMASLTFSAAVGISFLGSL
jgi:hypothetical protein